MDSENLLATPSSNIELSGLLGKKAQYVDKNGKIWPAIVKAIDDPFIVVKFDEFPMGLGQGQILEVFEESDQV